MKPIGAAKSVTGLQHQYDVDNGDNERDDVTDQQMHRSLTTSV
jgi:hypothetical protein